MEWNAALWQESIEEFKRFMTPLVSVMGRSERRVSALQYVEGLLLPGGRKSIVPLAERVRVDAQKLQQFMTDSPWLDREVWRVIRQEIIPQVEPLEAWIVDETGWVKQGRHSVGVGNQYCGSVGKNANCQVSVEVVVSNGWIAAPVAGRLYLPEKWTKDPPRCAQVGVPPGLVFQTKPEIALDLIEQVLADGVPQAPVLADAAYGDSSDFRQQLRQWGLEFFVQVTAKELIGWDYEVETVLKRTRRHPVASAPPAQTLEQLAAKIPEQEWKGCEWTAADGETRSTRIAWTPVYLAHDLSSAHGVLQKLWLVIDWPAESKDPYHYYLAHFHGLPQRTRCLKLSRCRWHIEQYYQRSKDDLGLDHYEGRTWRGFHHHLVLASVAYLFVLMVYLRNVKKNFWPHVGTDAAPDTTVLAEISRLLFLLRNHF